MYRPTVRYADIFKGYVDELFHATYLDRNQIIRGALFAAAQSDEFIELLKPYIKPNTPLPLAPWHPDQHGYWLERTPDINERGEDVRDEHKPNERQQGALSTERIRIQNTGGIQFTLD